MTRKTGKHHRVLVMSTLGVGDILLAQPLFSAIAQHYANWHIAILARTGPPALLARRLGTADEIVEYVPKWPHRALEAFTIGSWIRMQRFSTVLVTTGMNPYYSGIMALVSRAQVRIGERRGRMPWAWTATAPVSPGTHVVERNHAIGRALGIEVGLEPRFMPNQHEKQKASELVSIRRDTVAVIPGSNRHLSHKRWPPERYVGLLRALSKRGYHSLLLGGPDEDGLGGELVARVESPKVLNLVGKTCLGTAAAILSSCRLAVGNDGMLLHLAAATGTPTLAIFGPSDPTLYRPWGTGHGIIGSALHCAPCSDRTRRRCSDHRCLTELPVETVVSRVFDTLQKIRNQEKTGTENGL